MTSMETAAAKLFEALMTDVEQRPRRHMTPTEREAFDAYLAALSMIGEPDLNGYRKRYEMLFR